MILVVALSEAHGAQQVHVSGTEVLEGAMVDGTGFSSLIAQDLHHVVHPKGLLLLVFLEVPGTQRHLALQTDFHSRQLLVNAVVAKNLLPLGLRLREPVQLALAGLEALDNAAELKVPLQGVHVLEFQATLRALWRLVVDLGGGVGRHPYASSAVVVSTGEDNRIREELKADGAAQLVGQQLTWFGKRHDEKLYAPVAGSPYLLTLLRSDSLRSSCPEAVFRFLLTLLFFPPSEPTGDSAAAVTTTGNTGRCTP